jgi:N-acyl-D-aspartate/D-glutamate deacylase
MSEGSILITNALIVDGSGAAPFEGSIAIENGKITGVGDVSIEADQVIDAGGKAVAPGFIDIHTHYDPQICWDRLATPSIEHGCTTVVMGNCSLSVAPVKDKGAADKLISMFRVIEDIGNATFDEGVPWSWESFPEYLDFVRDGLGINVGALVGHSTLRYYVMGEESQDRAATDEELDRMCTLLKEAMKAGAIGLSTSYVDVDENFKPVPSRLADYREKVALAKAMAETGRGIMQTVPNFIMPGEQIKCIEELADISKEAGIACTLAPIIYSPISDLWKESLEKLEEVNADGARVYGQSMPRPFDLNMRLSENSMLIMGMPTWAQHNKMPLDERQASYADTEKQDQLIAEMDQLPITANMWVGEVFTDEHKELEGKKVTDIAAEKGVPVGRVVLDLANADGLQTEFQVKGAIHGDEDYVSQILDHPLCHVGASDAGAHIAQFAGAGDTCHILSKYVRERGDMTLERAVYRMTHEVAEAWGIQDRGLLKEGMAADVVIFDPATIDRGEEVFVHDVPGDANRYVRHPEGVDTVLINGAIAHTNGAYTGATVGQIV